MGGAPAMGGGQPSMMKSMMATAGGVALGSVAGSMITDKLRGSGDDNQDAAAPPPQQQQYDQQQQQNNPCQGYMQQFMDCANQHDLTMCEAFQDQWKQCKVNYGM